jgi:hypothetical protein
VLALPLVPMTGTDNPNYQASVSEYNAGYKVISCADRNALKALTIEADRLASLSETGREGLFIFDDSDLSAKVAADTSEGIYVAPASDADGSSGAWVRQWVGSVSPLWWGIVPSSSGAAAANSTARDAMLATLFARAYNMTGLFYGLEPIQFDHRKYWFSTTWDLHDGSARIYGTMTGQPTSVGTTWKFPSGVDAVIFQYYNTSGETDGPTGDHAFAQGSHVKGIRVEGDFATSGTEGEHHGFVLRTPVKLEDCQAIGFEGDGFHAHASSGGGGMLGNANLFQLYNCTSQNNRRGISLAGTDVNAFVILGGSFDNNRQAGFYEPDNASLGGLVLGTHFDSNGHQISGSFPSATTSYSGNRYGVIYGQEAWCSTNAPSGTTADNQGWYFISAGGVLADYPAWLSGSTYRAGGPVICQSVNSVTQFVGCYSEGASTLQPQMSGHAWVSGGSLADFPIRGTSGGGGAQTYQSQDGFLFNRKMTSKCVSGALTSKSILGGSGALDSFWRFETSGGKIFTWNSDGTFLRWDSAQTGQYVMGVTTAAVGLSFGRGANVDDALVIPKPVLGGTNGRLVGFNTGQPADGAAGDYGQGELRWELSPAVGGSACYIRTTSNVWKPVGIVGAVQAAARADVAVRTSADATNAVAAPTQAEFNALVAEFNKLRADYEAGRVVINDLLAKLRASVLLAT